MPETGIRQEITAILDAAAMAELEQDLVRASVAVGTAMREAVDQSGADQKVKDDAMRRVEAMRHAIEREAEALKLAVQKGLLTREEAGQIGQQAGQEFADKLQKELERLHREGLLTRTEIAQVGKRLGADLGVPFQNLKLPAPDTSLFTRAVNGLKGLVIGAAGAMTAALSLRALVRFGQEAVREYLEAERVQSRLVATVERLGVAYQDAAPHVEKVVELFVAQGRGTGDEARRTFQELLAITGDFRGSMEAVGLASDFAAKHGISLERATELVGRAMIGQVTPLRRFGIELKAGETSMEALRRSVGGFVEDEASVFSKSINRFRDAWGNLKQGIGEVLVTGAAGESAFDGVTRSVKDMTEWITTNRTELGQLVSGIVSVAGAFAKSLVTALLNTARELRVVAGLFDLVGSRLSRIEATVNRIGARSARLWGNNERADDLLRAAEEADAHADRLDARGDQRLSRPTPRDPRFANVVGGHVSALRPPSTDPDPRDPSGRASGDPQQERIRLLIEATRHERTRAAALTALLGWEQAIQEQLERANLSLEARVYLERQLAEVQEALGQQTPIRQRALSEQVEFYTRLLELTDRRATALEHLGRVEAALRRERAGTLDPGRVDEIDADLARINAARKADEARQRGGFGVDPNFGGIRGVDLAAVDAVADEITMKLGPMLEDRLNPTREFLLDTFGTSLREVAAETAEFIGAEFDAVFERLYQDGATLTETLAGLGKGLAAGMVREVATLAKTKARENLANAVEQTALGIGALFTNPAKAGSHFKSAASHVLAAARWSALGGAAGAAADGISGGGAGGGGRIDREFRERDGLRVEPGGRGTATIEIVGSDLINLGDRRAMDQLQEALELAQGYNVVIRRGRY